MNGYIIEPMWFYWVNVLDSINVFAVFMCILGIVGSVVCFILSHGCYSDEEYEMWKKRMKICFGALVLSAIIVIFVPSSETLIKMKLAEFGTYENVSIVVETIENMTDKIIEQIK